MVAACGSGGTGKTPGPNAARELTRERVQGLLAARAESLGSVTVTTTWGLRRVSCATLRSDPRSKDAHLAAAGLVLLQDTVPAPSCAVLPGPKMPASVRAGGEARLPFLVRTVPPSNGSDGTITVTVAHYGDIRVTRLVLPPDSNAAEASFTGTLVPLAGFSPQLIPEEYRGPRGSRTAHLVHSDNGWELVEAPGRRPHGLNGL